MLDKLLLLVHNTNIKIECYTYTKREEEKTREINKMLSVKNITNVNITPNKNISFGAGVQTNYGLSTPSPRNNMVEGGFLTGFVGTVAPMFSQIQSRAQKIEHGLNETKINYFA